MIMTRLLLIAAVIVAGCASSKKDGTTTANNAIENPAPPANNDTNKVPPCIKKLIDSFKTEPMQNPPRSIYSYTYQGKTVYYITPVCCDNFSELIDSNCKLIGHPDGGFTGRGDGRIPDFRTARTNEKLIWKDERK
jgi:hypothetical protein